MTSRAALRGSASGKDEPSAGRGDTRTIVGTTTLVDYAYHEPLGSDVWDADRARAAIRAIAAEAQERLEPKRWWPVHPLDEQATSEWGSLGLKIGAAGMLWGLDALRRFGLAELRVDVEAAARELHTQHRSAARPPGFATVDRAELGLWTGEAGVLLVACRLAPSRDRADRLFEIVAANIDNETNSLIWGSPGTMLAAEAMAVWTGEERWRRLWLECAEQLWREWRPAVRFACRLWGQRMFGGFRAYLGSIGLAGNIGILSRAGALLGLERVAELERRAIAAVSRFALRANGLANWAPWAGLERRADRVFHVQWCHGAPGIICSLATLAPQNETLSELLLAGGELTWRAGPPADRSFLCCGTGGSGFALLKLFERTGDVKWLERARAFAMHAIGQVERQRASFGQGRFSLWTGDLGVALYLAACLDGSARVPTIDSW